MTDDLDHDLARTWNHNSALPAVRTFGYDLRDDANVKSRLVEMQLGGRVILAIDGNGEILVHDKAGCAEYFRRAFKMPIQRMPMADSLARQLGLDTEEAE
jgi:hypothetical protein